MSSQILHNARQYEETYEKDIRPEDRPAFHLTPRVGWMNDPNGFSFYQGKYHLFYQYYPYASHWDSMHWGHAVSEDLLCWEYLPAAMAPDQDYDKDGVFSGSAITLEDGRQLLVYTGVEKQLQSDGQYKEIQVQCGAIGDGLDYQKLEANPVIKGDTVPEGSSIYDFRDPKVWQKPDGTYRLLVGNRAPDGTGHLLLYKSEDACSWEFQKVFAKNEGRLGSMWECPDFFELDGKGIVLISPQDMLPQGLEYHGGNGTVCLIGSYDADTDTFTEETNQAVDYGLDFYAMQTVLTPDGRRVMIGWMQNWETSKAHSDQDRWFGQMSLPREVSLKNGRLYQQPIRELEQYRGNKVEYKDVLVKGSRAISSEPGVAGENSLGVTLEGVEGRLIDLEVEISGADADTLYDRFTVSLAADNCCHTDICFRPKESVVTLDRTFSGSRYDVVHQRQAKVASTDGTLKMRIIMDRFSLEVFLEDGREVMSAVIYTDMAAEGIRFTADQDVRLQMTKYDLEL
ncbi:MAG: glycoside hydrolase family 32 protein [Lachnospiraceae bacterium]|nr:glycoside hydrolase family 32 protein [Lachnospiraceae bacterium]